jgi:hypothetical protein
LKALNNGRGAIRGTAVHHQDFCKCLRLGNETFKTIFNSRHFVKDRKDNANALGPELIGGLDTCAACSSDEAWNNAKSQDDLQRT